MFGRMIVSDIEISSERPYPDGRAHEGDPVDVGNLPRNLTVVGVVSFSGIDVGVGLVGRRCCLTHRLLLRPGLTQHPLHQVRQGDVTGHRVQLGSPGVIAGKYTVITPVQPRFTIVLFSSVGTDMSVSRTSPRILTAMIGMVCTPGQITPGAGCESHRAASTPGPFGAYHP